MTDFSGDISNLVLKGNVSQDIGELSFDRRTLQVLMQMDGKTDVGTLSRKLKISIADLRPIITKLFDLGLVIPIQKGAAFLTQGFVDRLTDELSDAMGPIAEIVIEDELEAMGGPSLRVPVSRAAELINRLADQIPRQEKRARFQKAMLKRIQAM